MLLSREIELTSRPVDVAEWIATNSMLEIEVHLGNVIGQSGNYTIKTYRN